MASPAQLEKKSNTIGNPLTVNYLGTPDNGVIMASYIGSLLMSGGYL